MRKTASRGFTLLELLVVVGIIAILVSLAAVAYNTAQKRTRDVRRRSDMKAVQNALEQYYSANNFAYPPAGSCSQIESTTYLESGVKPADPGSYTYSYGCTSTTAYCICAQLEVTGSGNSAASCSYSGSPKNYYCVSNLQ